MLLRDRLGLVEERIRTTAARVGRSPKEITLLAVTKVFPASAILEAYELGLREFGENYVQEFAGKYPEVRDLPGIRFHFIGHLQSNKAAAAAELFHSIQTIDNERLAKRLNATNRSLDVMAEVKLSPEETKHGVEPAQLPPLLDAIRALPNLNLVGLMTMPPWSDTAEDSRTYFRRLKELAGQHGLPCLSMGMSHDLEVAIEEGATHVRVGTALFGSRKAFLNR